MKTRCVASCGEGNGLEGLEMLLNNFFYSKHWEVTEIGGELLAVDALTRKRLPDEKIFLSHKNSRYSILVKA